MVTHPFKRTVVISLACLVPHIKAIHMYNEACSQRLSHSIHCDVTSARSTSFTIHAAHLTDFSLTFNSQFD